METAEMLNSFFQSTFTLEGSDGVPPLPRRSTVSLTDITITEELVFEKLFKLKSFKVNGIHSYILKKFK